MFCQYCNITVPKNQIKDHVTKCPSCGMISLHSVSAEMSQCSACGKMQTHEKPPKINVPEIEIPEKEPPL